MKILMLSDVFPYPPTDGRRIPVYHYLRHISQKHEVFLFAFTKPNEAVSDEQIIHVKKFCIDLRVVSQAPLTKTRILRGLVSRWPLSLRRYFTVDAVSRLIKIVMAQKFDLIHAYGFNVGQFVPVIKRWSPLPSIWSPNDCMSLNLRRRWRMTVLPLVKRLFYRFEALRVAYYERFILDICKYAYVVSPVDCDALRSLCPSAKIEVIPNGVDTEYFAPIPVKEQKSSPVLVMTGYFGIARELEAVKFIIEVILPQVRKKFPDTKLWLVGGKPIAKIRALSSIDPNITVTGPVDDLRPFLRRADVYICGLQMGTGIKNRILEAMAMAKPVVSTPVGAEGMELEHGKHLIVAKSPEEFAAGVIRLLQDADLCFKLGTNGRDAVQNRFNWIKSSQKVMRLYKETTFHST